MIEWLLVGAAKILFGAVATVVLLPVVLWAAGGLMLLHHGLEAAHNSDRSWWFHAGRASVWAPVYVRRPVVVLGAITAEEAVGTIVEELSAALDHGMAGVRSGNPPPEVPPIQEANLRMPTTYPFERARHLAWPPFIGHRFAIGDRGA